MYTSHSASQTQIARYGSNEELDGLFKSIGKVFKGAAKIVGKVAAPALGIALGVPAAQAMQMAAAAQSPNQPYTGGVGVAVTGADSLNQRIAQLEYGQATRAGVSTAGALPSWIFPVGIAAAGGLALILILRK